MPLVQGGVLTQPRTMGIKGVNQKKDQTGGWARGPQPPQRKNKQLGWPVGP